MADKVEVAQAFVTIIPSMRGAQGTIAKELGAEKIGKEAGAQLGGGLTASIKDIAIGTTLGNIITAGLSKALEGAKQLFSDAFQGIADYQQNVGGVQKLYGNMGQSLEEYAASVGKSTAAVQSEWQALENAQNTVLKNAQGAYKTAGMSANTYMEMATSFSAALINSLGGDSEAAAAQTQVAMQAISDNWNTFGGDLGNIKNAYQGFAKQNYTMLDNLKLGYGGTKDEMKRLIADANEYAAATGRASDLTIESFSDVVTAVQLIQEKQHIAGTTAREAEGTISGSLNMLNAAWDNFLTGLGDNTADMGERMTAVTDSLAAAAANVIPAVIQIATAALQAVPGLIAQAFATIQAAIVPAIDNLTGGAATKVLEGVARITEPLRANVLPVFADVFGRIGEIIGRIAPVVGTLANGAMKVLEAAARAIGWAFDALSPVISFVTDLFGGAMLAAVQAVSGAFNVVGDVVLTLQDLFGPMAEFIVNKVQEIADKLAPIVDGIGGLIGGIGDFFSDPLGAIGDFVTGGSRDMNNLAKSTKTAFDGMSKTVKTTTDNMAKNVSTSTQTMSKTTQTNLNNMVSNAAASMTGVYSKVNKAMTDSVTKTRTSTQDMQTTINTLKGKEVNLTAKNALGTVVSDTQAKVNQFVGKTVNLAAKNALGRVVPETQAKVNELRGKTVELGAKKSAAFAAAIRTAQNTINSIYGKTVDITLNVKKKGIREISVERSYSGTGNLKYYVRTTMAQGGFLLGPTNVLAGEAGTEAIVPLSNTKYARPFAQAVAQEIDHGGGVNITVQEMNVRSENDIKRVAAELSKLVSRANGGRV